MREDKPIRSCKTSFTLAAQSSQHTLAQKSLKIDLNGLSSVINSDMNTFLLAAQHLLEKQPDLILLPKKLDFYCMTNNLDRTDNVLYVKKSGTLCATPDWVDESEVVLQSIRATHDCLNRPLYDSIRVQTEEGDSWFAELRLMFEYGGQKLVYVRWYDVLQQAPDDILSQYGCVSLKLTELYGVIPMDTIVCKEYILPDFKTRKEHSPSKVTFERYHVSVFKWDRLSVGYKEDLVDEYGNIIG